MAAPSPADVESAGLTFSILGPVEVARGGVPLSVASLKTRALLALLLLHRERPVSRALLIERIWDSPPPPTAPAAARNIVSGLRKLLGDDGRTLLATDADGYVLNAPAESLDRTAFDTLRTRGRGLLHAGDLDAAARCLRGALDRWRGPALMDLAASGFDWPETGALTETWLATVEDLIEVDLHRYRYREVLVRLVPLLAEFPGRETLHHAKIIALHRSGRRADAASAYLEAYRLITDRTGREPGAEFRDLPRRILAGEQTAVDTEAPPRPHRRRAPAPRRSVRRSDGGRRSLIPRIGSAEQSTELAHEVRAVAMLCVRVCAPTAPPSVIDRIGDVVREYGGVVGDIRDTVVVTYFGLAAHPFAVEETEAGTGATERAAACAVALHQDSSVDRVRAGDLNGDALAPAPDGPPRDVRLACVVSTGPIMHIVRANGPGDATSWVASETIGLCERRVEEVQPGETAVF